MFWIKKKKGNVVDQRKVAGAKIRSADKPRKFSHFLFYLLLISFFAVSLYVFLFSDFCKIKKIEVTGSIELPSDQIYNFSKSRIEGKYLKVFPRDNFFFVYSRSMEKALLDNFKKIKTVQVSKVYPDLLKIRIIERLSLLIWCSQDSCYILDEEGTAYSRVELNSPIVEQNNLIKLVDLSGKEVREGEKILDRGLIVSLTRLREEMEKSEIIDPGTDWKTPSPVSQKFEVESKEGWKLFFSAEVEPRKALRTLKIFLESEIGEDKKNDLEYIDLRVENKVFYKLKNEEKKESEGNEEDKNT